MMKKRKRLLSLLMIVVVASICIAGYKQYNITCVIKFIPEKAKIHILEDSYIICENLCSSVVNALFGFMLTNEKAVDKDIYGNNQWYWFWMHCRFRDLITRTIMSSVYLKNRVTMFRNRQEKPNGIKIVVDKSDGVMRIFKNNEVWKVYRVATGKVKGNRVKDNDNGTPEGRFRIIDKRIGKIGKNNHAKMVFFNTDWYPNIVIHQGYTRPRRQSAGCIHLGSRNMNKFYSEIPVGALLIIRE